MLTNRSTKTLKIDN